MSIQTKFIVLLLILGAAVAVSIGAAAWAVSIFHTAATLEFGSRSAVVSGLLEIEDKIQPQRHLLEVVQTEPAASDNKGQAKEILSFAQQMQGELSDLENLPSFRREAGISTSDNLRRRIDQYAVRLQAWTETGGSHNIPLLVGDLIEIEELVEHVNRRILEGATADIDHADELRRRTLVVMVLAIALTALVGMLGLLLVRRWVSRPVAALRAATATIAAGDFSHRVVIDGTDEIAQLGRDINHMAGTVARLQEERIETERLAAVGEVVRRLAHNLRNPMAGIRGLAELSRADAPAGSETREQQDRIIKTVDRFERWLSELLSVTRPLEVDPSSQDISAWLPPVVETLRPQAEHRGLTLEVIVPSSPLIVPIDPRHLEQAVVAAVANAIEASPRGGTIRISADIDTDAWLLRVADQGPGIPLHLRDQVFKPYFTTKPDGNGIGLAVVQQVVRAHGGRVLIDSGFGVNVGSEPASKGVTMTFTLPLASTGSSVTG